MKKSIIIGAGTQGQIYASYLKEAGIEVIGFIDDNDAIQGSNVNGLPVIGKYHDLFSKKLKDKASDVFCPIGNNLIRQKYLVSLKKEGYNTPSFIHHSVSIAPDVVLGEAIYMLVGNIIMPFTTIGNYLMVNMGTTIGHHVTIEDGVFMSSGVNVGASLTVRNMAYIGIGVTIIPGIETIGKESLIGAGTVIFKNVPDYAVMAGNPGRMIRTNTPKM
ncbi:acetyltransferase [Algibacter sp. AS12]|uniref:acetyltransferase n=1 Tax=Algibacter sp. AS12 TaxID=3135773 RepID=UPI00398A844A